LLTSFPKTASACNAIILECIQNDKTDSSVALRLLAGGPGIIAAQASTIAVQETALAACQEKLAAMHDLVAAVRAASVAGGGAVEMLLPDVGYFFTRTKDACSVCGSIDAFAFTALPVTGKPVCSRGCGVDFIGRRQGPNGVGTSAPVRTQGRANVTKRRRSSSVPARSRDFTLPEPTPIVLNQQAKTAKNATFVFIYCRRSSVFIPPPNLRESRDVLFSFVEQHFHSSYAFDGSPVFPGTGDVFVIPIFYVKLGPANTRIVEWEQEWNQGAGLGANSVQFQSPRQLIVDIHTVLSSVSDCKAVIVTNDAVDFGDCVHHFKDFLLSFTRDERQRLFLLTRHAGTFPTCATYLTEDLLAAINGQHQFVNVPFNPTFFLLRMWEGMISSLRANFQAEHASIRRRSVRIVDYSVHLEPPVVAFRSLIRM
jgi:hypothetical protein